MLPLQAPPQPVPQEPSVRLEATVVEGRDDSLIGLAPAASTGLIGAEELARRPLLRGGEVLEAVPGVIVTQHSGAGKANQFFLRGFNVDHGTDLATFVDGAPINLPSHGHGQGYTDLNFLIPELVKSVGYRKGPYFADLGDFASAGAVEIEYVERLERGVAGVTVGGYDFMRAVVADSLRLGGGDLVFAAESQYYDGPWRVGNDNERFNGLLKWTRGSGDDSLSFTLSGMESDWNATDQIPLRAVQSGALGRFDAVDPTDGGQSERLAFSGAWRSSTASSRSSARFTLARTDLDLWSNFTYFLDDPLNGDQFQQTDTRTTSYLDVRHSWQSDLGTLPVEHSVGVQARSDSIDNSLARTRARQLLSTTRADDIQQTSAAAWWQSEVRWNDAWRTSVGLRGDLYDFDVASDNPANSGDEQDSILSVKFGTAWAPWSNGELYANAGTGFHSNDARGVLTTDDPATPAPGDATPVDPLVRTVGAELGARASFADGQQSTLSLWWLKSDNEILFVGDAGTTEPSRPSRRYGVEFANFLRLSDTWTADLDLSWSHARFRDDDPAGDFIPGAVETVVAAGLTYADPSGFFGGVRVRHFGPRPLIEDDSVRSQDSTLVYLQLGQRLNEHVTLSLDVFNLFDEDARDIEYFYASQLAGEAAPVDDVHFHPAEPLQARLSLRASF